MLIFLDYFFIVFHSAFTLFNLVGWIWRKTRKIHLITIGLTLISWFILGIWYGMGYCICTDWHWQIRYKLSKPSGSRSYIHFLIKEITGIDLNENFVDYTVLIVFLIAISLSLFFFIKDIRAKKQNNY